jgi:hypothetical protein
MFTFAGSSNHFGYRRASWKDAGTGTAGLGSAARARENFDISALPEDALDEINRIQTR